MKEDEPGVRFIIEVEKGTSDETIMNLTPPVSLSFPLVTSFHG